MDDLFMDDDDEEKEMRIARNGRFAAAIFFGLLSLDCFLVVSLETEMFPKLLYLVSGLVFLASTSYYLLYGITILKREKRMKELKFLIKRREDKAQKRGRRGKAKPKTKYDYKHRNELIDPITARVVLLANERLKKYGKNFLSTLPRERRARKGRKRNIKKEHREKKQLRSSIS